MSTGGPVPPAPELRPSSIRLFLLGVILLAEVATAIYLLIAIWPSLSGASSSAVTKGASATTHSTTIPTIHLFGIAWTNPSIDALYLVAVILLGAIGASVAALTSFATFVGNRTFVKSWFWWYLIRLPVGSALGVIFYFVLRGGLLTVSTATTAISPYGIGAVAGLAGMFSKQATDKLNEVFTTLFRTKSGTGDEGRSDNLDGSQPEG